MKPAWKGKALTRPLVIILSALLLTPPASAAQIIDLSTGAQISEDALAEQLRTRDVVLLGELHDNARHHALRARLIARFAGKQTTVVAEHLPAPARVTFHHALRDDLESAGFDTKGWGWPLHEPLFDAIRVQGLPLVGGNLPKGFSKQLMMKGETALPSVLADAYRKSPLSSAAQGRLDSDLVDGHCGKLPEKYVPPMRLVQRATDLSMAEMLLEHRPSVLVAGNGHVRKDYGVPQVITALAPSANIAAVGFYEEGTDRQELVQSLAGRYDYVWLTERAERSDPCENFKIK